MSKSLVYYGAPSLSASAPSLSLLWRRRWYEMLTSSSKKSASYLKMTMANPCNNVKNKKMRMSVLQVHFSLQKLLA